MKFADLEHEDDASHIEGRGSSLSDWYRSVREIPIADLDLGDLCRAVRQRLFIAHVLPIAVSYLETDVLAGDDYDGQLISSLHALTQVDWRNCPAEAQRTEQILRGALAKGQLISSSRADATVILDVISKL